MTVDDPTSHYDLLVVGGGPAGEKGAAQAAYFGKRVALVDRSERLGGTVGESALPLKGLRETALYLNGFRQRNLHGFELVRTGDLSPETLLRRGRTVSDAMAWEVRRNMERHGVDVFHASASFVGDRRLALRGPDGERELSAEVVLLTPGTVPVTPPPFDIEHPRVWDSSSVLRMESLPASLLVVGGGSLGCEYACIFAALGIEVTLVQREEGILPTFDEEIAGHLTNSMTMLGVDLVTGERVEELVAPRQRDSTLCCRTDGGRELEAEALLVAIGRRCELGELGLERGGVELTERGFLRVDETFRTTAPGVYAAGDAIGGPGLSSLAMEQGRMAMVHAFDLRYKEAVARVSPTGTWTIPEASMVGACETELRERGVDYVVGRARHDANPRGIIIGETTGMLKLLFERDTRRLLGAHCIGEEACEVIATAAVAMNQDAGLDLFIDMHFNYPSLSDLFKYAAYDALGALSQGGSLSGAGRVAAE